MVPGVLMGTAASLGDSGAMGDSSQENMEVAEVRATAEDFPGCQGRAMGMGRGPGGVLDPEPGLGPGPGPGDFRGPREVQ